MNKLIDSIVDSDPEDVPLWFGVSLFIVGFALLIVELSWVAVIAVFLMFWSMNISNLRALARATKEAKFRTKSDYVTKERFGVLFEDLARDIEKVGANVGTDYVTEKHFAASLNEVTQYILELESRVEELGPEIELGDVTKEHP